MEAVGVLKDAMNESAQHVGVGAAAAFPLGVDLEDHDVIGGDEAVGAAQNAVLRGLVEFFAVQRELMQQRIHADVSELAVVRGAVIYTEDRGPRLAGFSEGVEMKGAQDGQGGGGAKEAAARNAAER